MADPHLLLSHAAAKKVDRAVARLEELQSLLCEASTTMRKRRSTIGFGHGHAMDPPTTSDGHSTTNATTNKDIADQRRPRRPLACTTNTRPHPNKPMDCHSSSKKTTSSSSYRHCQHAHHQHCHDGDGENHDPDSRPMNYPSRNMPVGSRRRTLCSPRPTSSVSTAASTTLDKGHLPMSRKIGPASAPLPDKMPTKKLLFVNAYPANPSRPWHFSSSTSGSKTSTSGSRTSTSGSRISTQTTTMSGQTTAMSSQTTTTSGDTNRILGGNSTSMRKTKAPMQTTSLSRQATTSSGRTTTMSGGRTPMSRKETTAAEREIPMSRQKATKFGHETRMSVQETTEPAAHADISRHHHALQPRLLRRLSLPNQSTSDCSGFMRPLTRRISFMTKPLRAFRASPPNASLPSLITRLPTRQRSSSSMLWNHHHHHEGKGPNEEGEVSLSASLPSVLPLPPALQQTNGSTSSMRQRLLPPLGESHNASKATPQSSCPIHIGKENCFSGCNPMALLKRSFSTPLDSGDYILESEQGYMKRGIPSSQTYTVESPFQTWKPKPKLYFV